MALTVAQAQDAATAIVDNYAPGAPADVRTAAVELLARTIKAGPEIAGAAFADQKVDYHNLGPALIRRCGAASMLAPWAPAPRPRHRGGIVIRDWLPWRRPREARESSGYTSAIVSAIDAAAAGGGGVATATAAVETASGLWGRALALADVTPRSSRTAAITPSFLELAGRELGRRGELVCDIDVDARGVRLFPAASSYVVIGGHRPEEWVYTLTLFGPGRTVTVYRHRAGVAHLAYGRTVERPWEGRAPWQSASLAGNLLAGVERQLAGEARGSSGYILAIPDTGDHGQDAEADGNTDPLDALRTDLAAAGGKTVLAPTTAAGYGAGPAAAPPGDYRSARFGMNPPEATVEARRDVERSILGCYGVPPILMAGSGAGSGMREGWRQLIGLTVEPLATLIGSQLSEALGVEVTLDMRRARAADVVMLARAVGSLTTAGMPLADAREVVGL